VGRRVNGVVEQKWMRENCQSEDGGSWPGGEGKPGGQSTRNGGEKKRSPRKPRAKTRAKRKKSSPQGGKLGTRVRRVKYSIPGSPKGDNFQPPILHESKDRGIEKSRRKCSDGGG